MEHLIEHSNYLNIKKYITNSLTVLFGINTVLFLQKNYKTLFAALNNGTIMNFYHITFVQ